MIVDLVAAELDRVHERIAGRFARAEPRSRVREYVSGLVAGLDRRGAAGIPEEVEFATRPRQAQAMIARAIAAGVPFAWFTADEIYGQAKYLQAWLEDQDVSYVMAIRCSDTLTTPEGEQRA